MLLAEEIPDDLHGNNNNTVTVKKIDYAKIAVIKPIDIIPYERFMSL